MLAKLKRTIERRLLNRFLPHNFYFSKNGFCPCCEKPTEFLAYNPWLRDHFRCVNCGSIPRQRALLKTLETHFPKWRELAIHESSPSNGGASARIRAECSRYISSQYYPHHEFGETILGHRNENLEAMTFPNAIFDIVISQDVMEHVYDPATVFREVARILKPGGAHVFTVPIVNKHGPSQVWATKNEDGSPRFLYQPDYHGNPVDPCGSPVTMRWGYDIVQFIEMACGLNTSIEYIDDLEIGVRAEYIEVLVTRKPLA